MDFYNLMKKNGNKNTELFQKSLFLARPTIRWLPWQRKNDGRSIDISKSPQRMKKQLLSFRVNHLFKTLMGWVAGIGLI